MSRLGIEFVPSGLAPLGTVAVAELRDDEDRRVDQLIVTAGTPAATEVSAGAYAIRVELASGDYVDEHVTVGERGANVRIDAGPALGAERLSLLQRAVDKLAEGRDPHVEAMVWEYDADGGSWTHEDVTLHTGGTTTLTLAAGPHRMLSYDNKLFVVPAARGVEVTLENESVVVKPKSAQAEALSAYLEGGRLDLCAAFADALLLRPDWHVDDPAVVTLVGYYLVRSGRYDDLARWRERVRPGGTLPDQQIVEAWSWLRGGNRERASARLLDAVAAGVPAYRDGVQLLLDGLRLMAAKDDPAVAAALSQAQTYALASDAGTPLTSFPGAHPQEPEPAPAQVLHKDEPWTHEPGHALAYSERRLRVVLLLSASAAGVCTLTLASGIEAGWFDSTPEAVTLAVVLTLLSVLGAADVKRFGWLSTILAVAYAVLIYAETSRQDWTGTSLILFPLWLLGASALLALIVRWSLAAARDGSDLRYLHPVAYHTLVAVAEVLVDAGPRTVPADEVARNVDRYVARLRHRGRIPFALLWLIAVPILSFKPPVSALEPDARKHLLARHLRSRRRTTGQAVIRLMSQLVYLGYYGDPRSWPSIGYEPTPHTKEPPPPLKTLAVPPRGGRAGYDTIIVGSGAAGAVLAYRLAESGRRVLVLERGPRPDPERYTPDEAGGYRRLYSEAGLQMSADFGVQIFQGACVGGGSSLHRGLAMPPPTEALDVWADHGIDRQGLEQAMLSMTKLLEMDWPPARELSHDPLMAALRGHEEPEERYGMPLDLGVVDSVLARAQREFPGRVEVLSDCDVKRINMDGGRARSVSGRYAGSVDVEIPAGEVVVAAGAIRSSQLLRRSRIGGDAVGRNLHLNLSCGVTAEFAKPLQRRGAGAYRPVDRSFVIETWPTGPVELALAMPGWFDRHIANMAAAPRMAHAAVLVQTTTPGRVRRDSSVELTVGAEDTQKLVAGIERASIAYLEAGARRVMPSTLAKSEIYSPQDLAYVFEEAGGFALSSSHPQGGNAIGAVVDEGLRVRFTENLYVCDSSVFPTSVGVEPQLTVMAMAEYGARQVVERASGGYGVTPSDMARSLLSRASHDSASSDK